VDDNEDAFPYNVGADDPKKDLNWASNVMSWELDPDNTNTVLLARGGLGPYSEGVISIYKCPSDHALSDPQQKAGWTARVRSVSMNAMIGNAGDFTQTGYNTNNPHYRQFFRSSQVPDPSRIFVLIEEHPDSIDDGYFLNKPADLEWTDLPASYHGGAANLTFADGHVETHKWLSGSTKPPPYPEAAKVPFKVKTDGLADFEWLMERTSMQRYYKPAVPAAW
jgi:prepilin-type processing-associated H-X9-DG protein